MLGLAAALILRQCGCGMLLHQSTAVSAGRWLPGYNQKRDGN